MAITKDLTVWCDYGDCVEWRHVESSTSRAGRSEARRAGWTRKDDMDLCPEHRMVRS